MIDTVVSVKLPIGEMLRIKRNRLMPDHVTGEEKRICLVSGIYGDGSKQNFTILRES